MIVREISKDIYKFEIDENGLYFMLPFGNKNIRIDSIGNALATKFNLDIDNTKMVRLHQYVEIDNKFVMVGDFLKKIKK